jgi:hypothetical protein
MGGYGECNTARVSDYCSEPEARSSLQNESGMHLTCDMPAYLPGCECRCNKKLVMAKKCLCTFLKHSVIVRTERAM